ncbi:MAG TPA: phosphatase PAP2 family protein [Stellaceae bacterium]|nr:phosphatase PAP2 family protein [Stellaceae bacterium]
MTKVASPGVDLPVGTARLWRSWWAFEWATIVAVIAIDLICAAVTGLPMENLRSGYPAMVALMIGIWAILSLGSRLTGVGRGTAWIAEMPAKLSLALAGLATLQYYAVSISAQTPLADDLLIRIDRVMGFDWLTVCRWLASHPPVVRVLMLAYEALLPEAAAVLLILVFIAPHRARRFSTALIVSLLPTVAILWLLPVEGAFAHYQISSPPDFVVTFQKLRSHELTLIPSVSDGIVSFPSYHACAAVLLTYFVRDIRIAFPVAVTVNGLMIAATPLFGGHYLADVLAGIMVAAATIAFLERQARSAR